MDKTCVCVGLQSQYIIVDYETGHIQDLFPYDSEKTRPIVTRISKVCSFFSESKKLNEVVVSGFFKKMYCILCNQQPVLPIFRMNFC